MGRSCLRTLVLIAVSFAVYAGNGETIASFDSLPATLFAYQLFEHQTLYDDDLRGTYLAASGAGYAFVEAPNGHLVSLFPIGTSLLTLPAFAAIDALATARGAALPRTLSAAFEDRRRFDEKLVAALVASLAVALCYATLRLFATPWQAGLATVAFGFAGEMWTIGAQGLWQHGPLNLVLLGAVFCTLRACAAPPGRATAWWSAAGACSGFLVTIRPTALLFTAALAFFVAADASRRPAWRPFAAGVALGLAPAILWNAVVFHSLVGGYVADARMYDPTPSHVGLALAGLLISPSRGWLIFSPIVLFSAAGLVRAARARSTPARLVSVLGAASFAVLVNYAFYSGWIGGHCYGPRFLTDLSAVTALALPFVVPPSLAAMRVGGRRRAARSALFAGALATSTVVQIVGSYSGAAGPLWNAIPVGIGFEPARIWATSDTQIERNARAMFYRYAPIVPTAGPAYARGFAGTVTGLAAHGWLREGRDGTTYAVASGTSTLAEAALHNDGRSTWYGYDTAVYNGEARVAATVRDEGGVVSVGELYVAGQVPPGQDAVARGLLVMPAAAGRYVLVLEPRAFGRSDIPPRNLRALHLRLDVR